MIPQMSSLKKLSFLFILSAIVAGDAVATKKPVPEWMVKAQKLSQHFIETVLLGDQRAISKLFDSNFTLQKCDHNLTKEQLVSQLKRITPASHVTFEIKNWTESGDVIKLLSHVKRIGVFTYIYELEMAKNSQLLMKGRMLNCRMKRTPEHEMNYFVSVFLEKFTYGMQHRRRDTIVPFLDPAFTFVDCKLKTHTLDDVVHAVENIPDYTVLYIPIRSNITEEGTLFKFKVEMNIGAMLYKSDMVLDNVNYRLKSIVAHECKKRW